MKSTTGLGKVVVISSLNDNGYCDNRL